MKTWAGGLCVGALVVALTACGGSNPAPAPLASATPTTEPSVSPRPDAASTPRATASPSQVVRLFFSLSDRAQNGRGTGRLRTLVDGCDECTAFADQVDSIYANGGVIKTRGTHVKRIEVETRTKTTITFEVVTSSAPTKYRRSRLDPWITLAGGDTRARLTLVGPEPSWKVTELVRLG